ncbi:hypothetical protein ACS0TY_022654 [Phlomoides rotata]
MCKYDWSKMIVDLLISRIKSSQNLKVVGCAIFLPYLLCEHFDLIRPLNDQQFPRFLKWHLCDLNKKLLTLDISELTPKYLRRVFLKPKSTEKEMFKNLLDHWNREFRQEREATEQDLGATVQLGTWKAVECNVRTVSVENEPSSSKRCGNNEQVEKELMFSDDAPGSEKTPNCAVSNKFILDAPGSEKTPNCAVSNKFILDASGGIHNNSIGLSKEIVTSDRVSDAILCIAEKNQNCRIGYS